MSLFDLEQSREQNTFKGYARMCVFHCPFKSGHSGKCGANAPKPVADIPAHDTYCLDWESFRDTPEQVRSYCEEWDDAGGEYYIVAVEAKATVVEKFEPQPEPGELFA